MTKKETISWILEQFNAMGATWLQIKIEQLKMSIDANHLQHNMWLLNI